MSAYLTSLAATLTQPDEGIRPRLPGRFESIHGRTALPSAGLDEPAESVTVPAMADSSDRHSSQRPPRSENQQSDAARSTRSPKSAEQTSAGREPVNRDAVERPLPVALLVPGEHAEVAASPSAPTSAELRPGRLVPGVERGSKGPLPAGSPARPAHATLGLEDHPHPVPDEPDGAATTDGTGAEKWRSAGAVGRSFDAGHTAYKHSHSGRANLDADSAPKADCPIPRIRRQTICWRPWSLLFEKKQARHRRLFASISDTSKFVPCHHRSHLSGLDHAASQR